MLSEVADVAYLVSRYYDPATEKGIAWDDPEVGVDWQVAEPLLSERDKTAPRLAEIADDASLVSRGDRWRATRLPPRGDLAARTCG